MYRGARVFFLVFFLFGGVGEELGFRGEKARGEKEGREKTDRGEMREEPPHDAGVFRTYS